MDFLNNEMNETVSQAQDMMIEATETTEIELFDFTQEAAEALNASFEN